MLLRQMPNDFSKVIGVNTEIHIYLQKCGEYPIYLYNNVMYYPKTQKIISYINEFEKGGEKNLGTVYTV